MKLKKWKWGVLGIIMFHLGINGLWLWLDKTPPAWDSAFHIKEVVIFSRMFKLGFLETIKTAYGYPPLIYFFGSIWGKLVGVGVDKIVFLNSIFLGLLLWGEGKLLGLFVKKRWRFWGVLLFSLFPVVYQTSREFLLDLPLTMLVVWALWAWIKSKDFLIWKYSLVWCGCLILASLVKLNGFVYFGPMVMISLIEVLREKKWERLGNLAILGLLWLGGVAWWWVMNFENIFNYLTGLAGKGEPLTDPMNLLSLVTWGHYLKLFFLQQLGPVASVAFFVSLICCWGGKEKKTKDLLSWAGINYVIFTMIKNKDFRFTLPLLPVVGVVMVTGFAKMKKKWGFWTSYFLTGFLLLNLLANSFAWFGEKGFKLSYKSALFGWVDVVNWSGDYPVKKIKREKWPNVEIVMDLEKLAIERRKKIRVLALINREEINDNNLLMYQTLKRYEGFILEAVGARERFVAEGELLNFLKNFDYVLVADRDYEVAPFYAINLEAYEQARDEILKSEGRLKTYRVYGGKNLFLYRNAFVD